MPSAACQLSRVCRQNFPVGDLKTWASAVAAGTTGKCREPPTIADTCVPYRIMVKAMYSHAHTHTRTHAHTLTLAHRPPLPPSSRTIRFLEKADRFVPLWSFLPVFAFSAFTPPRLKCQPDPRHATTPISSSMSDPQFVLGEESKRASICSSCKSYWSKLGRGGCLAPGKRKKNTCFRNP
jgi:hypothetical protein